MCYYPQEGWTALHLAAQEGKVDVVRLLTEAQALVNIQTQVCTSTTLHMSCLMNDLLCFNQYNTISECLCLFHKEVSIVMMGVDCRAHFIHMYRMAELLSTLPVRRDMEQLLNYYFIHTLMSASVRR